MHFTVGADDAESFVELSGPSCFFELRQHMVTVFRVNDVLVRSWIVRERLTRSSRDRLVSVVYVQRSLGFRVDHPEDLLDIRRHLPEPRFAFMVLT
jgi:hypothetical protein